MNVPIPGQSAEFSFLGILAVMALLLTGMVAYFRRRGWL
jgi:Mg2+ and Co2+ transporter CorA